MGGVRFDLNSDGEAEQISWTSEGSDDAFLVLDRNGNNRIDDGQELFGNFTPQPESPEPNGFLALQVFDGPAHDGNSDGRITAEDAIFSRLALWIDINHNGFSETEEIHPIGSSIVAIELSYKETHRTDRHGNEFRYVSTAAWADPPARKLVIDVVLVSADR
ncbi:MAG TPA: hypothetical protein VLV83_26440 [Acidobacteriota bacterium]|nr:hypothetical protein [Acidobacteriota bacterium]